MLKDRQLRAVIKLDGAKSRGVQLVLSRRGLS